MVNNQIEKFGNYLMVDKGLGAITVEGYQRCMSIAIRRMSEPGFVGFVG